MKKYFLILFSLFLYNFILAQEFEVTYTDTLGYGQPGSTIKLKGYVKNLSSINTLTIKLVRMQNMLPNHNWTTSLCTGVLCYPSFVDSVGFSLLPDSTEQFEIYFNSDSVQAGEGTVQLKIATINNSQVETQRFIGSTMPNSIEKVNILQTRYFHLISNYPNPFNNQTVISAKINTPGKIRLHVYDILGREVYAANSHVSTPGNLKFYWHGVTNEGAELSSGIYLYRLSTFKNGVLNFSNVKKLTLLR